MSRAIESASHTSHPQVIWGALYILTQLKERPKDLGEAAYEWCALIWRNRHSYEGWEALLLLSLEVGFRHLRSPDLWTFPPFTGTEPHQEVSNTVLKSNDSEAVVDLAWASLMIDTSGRLGLSICADYILDFSGGVTKPFPKNLRQIFIFFVERMGLDGLKNVGKERFVRLLNHLHIDIEDMGCFRGCNPWTAILLEIVQSTEEARHLAIQSWELLAKLATRGPFEGVTYNPDVATSLVNGEEWDKLECWMGIVWMAWPREPGNVASELKVGMESLEKERPGSLRNWMEQWCGKYGRDVPESFQQTCENLAL